MRWQAPFLLVAGHVPHGRHLPTTFGRHCSLKHTPRLGFWSHQFPASCVTWTTPQRNCPSPIHQEHTPRLGLWSHQFPACWLHGPLRSGTAQAPPIRFVRSALSQHVQLHISASCQHKPQDRPSTCTFSRSLRGRDICTTCHGQAYWNQPFGRPATVTSLAERAHRPAYTFADGARPTFAGPPWTTGTAV